MLIEHKYKLGQEVYCIGNREIAAFPIIGVIAESSDNIEYVLNIYGRRECFKEHLLYRTKADLPASL